MTGVPLRAAPTLCCAALVALALLPAAAGATTTVTYSSTTGLLLQGNAAGDLTSVEAQANEFVVNGKDPGVAVPGSGCQQKSSIEVSCAYGSNRFVTANLDAGDDEFRVNNPFGTAPPVDSLVDAGGGNDVLEAGRGLDSFDGGPGNDVFTPFFSARDTNNDVFEGGDGNDVFHADRGGTDTLRGEAGSDRVVARLGGPDGPSATLFHGGSGTDVADYSVREQRVALSSGPGASAAPNDGQLGEGDDLDSVETLIGGSGGDALDVRNTLFGTARGGGTHTLRGNAGADTLRVINRLFSSLDGGAGSDTVTGGAERDVIFSREGEPDAVTCGGGIDTFKPDLRDTIAADCENLDQSDRREGPNVVFRTRLARVDEDGALTVRLVCPRSVRIGCRGGLAARLDRRGTRFGPREAYSLGRGRSTTVEVRLPARQAAAARRRGARVRVRSIERGVHGPKTTQRSLRARRR